jgi:predicted nucleic acid-binding protein
MNSMNAASNLQFVDTNILIYAHDRSAGPKHTRARELVQQLWQSREGCSSLQVLQEFYVNITRK